MAKGENIDSDSHLASTPFCADLGKLQNILGPQIFLLSSNNNASFAGLLRNNRYEIPGKHWAWHVKIHAAVNYCLYLKSHHCYFPVSPFTL